MHGSDRRSTSCAVWPGKRWTKQQCWKTTEPGKKPSCSDDFSRTICDLLMLYRCNPIKRTLVAGTVPLHVGVTYGWWYNSCWLVVLGRITGTTPARPMSLCLPVCVCLGPVDAGATVLHSPDEPSPTDSKLNYAVCQRCADERTNERTDRQTDEDSRHQAKRARLADCVSPATTACLGVLTRCLVNELPTLTHARTHAYS